MATSTRSGRTSSSSASTSVSASSSGKMAAPGGPALQRVVDLLLETTRTAKGQLEEKHMEHSAWLASALASLRARVLEEEAPAPAAPAEEAKGGAEADKENVRPAAQEAEGGDEEEAAKGAGKVRCGVVLCVAFGPLF